MSNGVRTSHHLPLVGRSKFAESKFRVGGGRAATVPLPEKFLAMLEILSTSPQGGGDCVEFVL
jgi:hypothetical protein